MPSLPTLPAPSLPSLPSLPGVPSRQQLKQASANISHKLLYGGLADLRPMPRTLIDDGKLREVYHYRPMRDVEQHGDPVLLVTPLAAPAICFDLRRGCSLVEHLLSTGRPVYLVEYGEISFGDRRLGVEHWIDEVVPAAIAAVHDHAGRRPVHLLGWSIGGTFAVLTAADRPDLPIASVISAGSPIDTKQVPMVAPLRPLLNIADGRPLTMVYRTLGGAPKPLVRRAFQFSSLDKLVTKPLALLTHLDDADFLAQIEAVDHFTDNMVAYPGRTFGQLYHRFVRDNVLSTGSFDLGARTIELAKLRSPLLVLAGGGDGIAPVSSVRPLMALVPDALPQRFEVVPGGHLGMLTGRAARRTTWVHIDNWLAGCDDRSAAADRERGSSGTKKSRKKAAPGIGTNPKRRYSSKASRNLGA